MADAGPLALIGGAEWQEGCAFDTRLIDRSDASEVLVLPTAAAYEHAERCVGVAREWFSTMGISVRGLEVLERSQAQDAELAEIVRKAHFIYLADGSPLHLRSVLKDSLVWTALQEAWRGGATVAGSSAGAMVLGDPMVDPRGGAFTLGLGLVRKLAVAPHWERWTGDKARRMNNLTPKGVVVAEIEEKTALIRWSDGSWEVGGSGRVMLTLAGSDISIQDVEDAIDVGPLVVPIDETRE